MACERVAPTVELVIREEGIALADGGRIGRDLDAVAEAIENSARTGRGGGLGHAQLLAMRAPAAALVAQRR